MAGDELRDGRCDMYPLFEGLDVDDCGTGLLVWGLDVGDESPLEAGAEAALETADSLRRAVAGENQLTAGGVQIVESVEELFLRALLVGQELDVIYEEGVGGTVSVAEIVLFPLADGGDELVGELLAGGVDDAPLPVSTVVSDGVEEVSLS